VSLNFIEGVKRTKSGRCGGGGVPVPSVPSERMTQGEVGVA
jgi:hypothetical protein